MEKNYNRRTEKDYGLRRKMFYKLFVRIVVAPVAKLMYNLKVEGRENLPEGSRYIYAGNHVSYLDPPLLTYAVGGRLIAYMAKQELFTADNVDFDICDDYSKKVKEIGQYFYVYG